MCSHWRSTKGLVPRLNSADGVPWLTSHTMQWDPLSTEASRSEYGETSVWWWHSVDQRSYRQWRKLISFCTWLHPQPAYLDNITLVSRQRLDWLYGSRVDHYHCAVRCIGHQPLPAPAEDNDIPQVRTEMDTNQSKAFWFCGWREPGMLWGDTFTILTAEDMPNTLGGWSTDSTPPYCTVPNFSIFCVFNFVRLIG